MDRTPRVFEDKTRWKLELAVVQEAWKIRVVHDGSNGVHVNHRIRPRDQARSPGAGDLRTIVRSKAALRSRRQRKQGPPPHRDPAGGLELPGALDEFG